jgi:hypothetical protein
MAGYLHCGPGKIHSGGNGFENRVQAITVGNLNSTPQSRRYQKKLTIFLVHIFVVLSSKFIVETI